MADTPPREPDGPLEELVWGGILEWRGGDTGALLEIVARLNALGVARAELDADGGRHSLLFDDGPVTGAGVRAGGPAALLDLLQELIDAGGDPRSAESTLHCSAVHADGVVETLIRVEDGRVRSLSRVRERTPGERRPASVRRPIPWSLVVPVGALVLVAFGLMAWTSGLLDRVLSSSPESITVETGPFGTRLAASVDRKWGNYLVTVTRGPDYPTSVEEVEAARAAATEISDRAAIDILAGGGQIYVQLRSADDTLLEEAQVELRPLVEAADGRAVARIPGRLGAAKVRLSLSSGKEP